MANKVWFNPRLPETLQGAILFSYLNAGFAIFGIITGIGNAFDLILLVGALGAVGMANQRKWGYRLACAVAIINFLLQLLIFATYGFGFGYMINLVFSIFLIALLFNVTSRTYQRSYFR